eukprot:346160-Amorphochlora_amoeboformis.AAC.2
MVVGCGLLHIGVIFGGNKGFSRRSYPQDGPGHVQGRLGGRHSGLWSSLGGERVLGASPAPMWDGLPSQSPGLFWAGEGTPGPGQFAGRGLTP